MKLQVGDKVLVLDEDQEGIVVEVSETEVIIETLEGFELTYRAEELLKIGDTSDLKKASSFSRVSQAIQEKAEPRKRNFTKEKKSRKEGFILEVDLHIEKLTKDFQRMEKYDMLTLQLDTARSQLEFAITNRIPRIVFIHGVGEGVLKTELEYLFGRYPEVIYEDANYQKYGLGATQIHIKQNPNR